MGRRTKVIAEREHKERRATSLEPLARATDMYARDFGVRNRRRNETTCVEPCAPKTNWDLDKVCHQNDCVETRAPTTDHDLESGWGLVRLWLRVSSRRPQCVQTPS